MGIPRQQPVPRFLNQPVKPLRVTAGFHAYAGRRCSLAAATNHLLPLMIEGALTDLSISGVSIQQMVWVFEA